MRRVSVIERRVWTRRQRGIATRETVFRFFDNHVERSGTRLGPGWKDDVASGGSLKCGLRRQGVGTGGSKKRMVLRWSGRKLRFSVRTIEGTLMAERDAGLGGAAGGSNGCSASEPLCALIAILCTSTKHLVESTFDEAEECDKLDDEQNGHEGLLCAIRFCPVPAQVVPE